MKSAWGVLWFVICTAVVISVVASMIRPWLQVILVLVILGAFAFISIKIWRFISHRRRFF